MFWERGRWIGGEAGEDVRRRKVFVGEAALSPCPKATGFVTSRQFDLEHLISSCSDLLCESPVEIKSELIPSPPLSPW